MLKSNLQAMLEANTTERDLVKARNDDYRRGVSSNPEIERLIAEVRAKSGKILEDMKTHIDHISYTGPSLLPQLSQDDTQTPQEFLTDMKLQLELTKAIKTKNAMSAARSHPQARGDDPNVGPTDDQMKTAYDNIARIQERINEHRTAIQQTKLQQWHRVQLQLRAQEATDPEVLSIKSDPNYARFIEEGQQSLTNDQLSFLSNLRRQKVERHVCSYIPKDVTDALSRRMPPDDRTHTPDDTWGECKEMLASIIPNLNNMRGERYTKEDHRQGDDSLKIGFIRHDTQPSFLISVYPERAGPEINLMLNLGLGTMRGYVFGPSVDPEISHDFVHSD